MKGNNHRPDLLALLACLFIFLTAAAEPIGHAPAPDAGSLWALENLFPWGVNANDAPKNGPEERAQMLKRLGFTQFAVDRPSQDAAGIEAQIKALKRHGIKILAWSVPDIDDPAQVVDWKTHVPQDSAVLSGQRAPAAGALSLGQMLELFKRHGVAPQLWFIRRMRAAKPVPPPSTKPFSEWTEQEKNQSFRQLLGYDPAATPQEQELRVRQEVQRFKPLAELAARYGITVGLYKHGGWIGMADNQIAIVERLKKLGVTNVGIVYNFVHARDELDDTKQFSALWQRMKPHVLAVNITGLHEEAKVFPILYPSQGARELEMMRAIQDSGWKGPIGLSPEKFLDVGGDAERHLRHNLTGLAWLAAELKRAGSGGPRPFPPVR